MATLADIRIPGRSSIDMAAWAIAAILGLSGLMMFYHGYAGFPELALPAGAGLLLAAGVVGAQGYRRKREATQYEDDAGLMMIRAIADTLPDAVVVKNLQGEAVFANTVARRQGSPASETKLPWRDINGKLLGWMEIAAVAEEAAPSPVTLPQNEIDTLVAQRTAKVRSLLAHIEASREEEKKVIAHKLHGELGASIMALSLHLAMLSKHLPNDLVFRERMRQMKDLLNSAAATTRSIQSALRPDKLDLFGLKAAIEDLAQQMSDSTGIACELHFLEQAVSRSAPVEIALYRMLEEALHNVTRHAYATQVDITLEEKADTLGLCIRDNGVGFSPADVQPGAHGLCRMKERANHLGGSLLIHSSPGQGTTIHITLPTQQEPAEREH